MSSERVNIISCPVDKKQEQRSVIPFFSPSKTEVGMEFRQSQFWMDPLFQSYLQQTVRFFLTKSEAAWLKDCSHLYLIKDRIYLLSCFIFLARAGPFWQFEKTFQIRIF